MGADKIPTRPGPLERSRLHQWLYSHHSKHYPLRDGEKFWEYEKRLKQRNINRGSMYPPMNIEPFAEVRERLGDGGMSEEDRMRRKIWVQDQKLASHGPTQEVPTPKNIFRRPYMKMGQAVEGFLSLFMKREAAMNLRNGLGRFTAFLLGVNFIYYHVAYRGRDPTNWESNKTAFEVVVSRKTDYTPEASLSVQHPSIYADRGFNSRTALKDYKLDY